MPKGTQLSPHIKPRPIVVVDPGHGGSDCGAFNPEAFVYESEINLDLAYLFAPWGAGDFDVIATRDTDENVSLEDRVATSNLHQADAFISFHCNSSEDKSVQGFEVWTSPGETRADALATAIFNGIKAACPDRRPRMDYDDGDPDKEAQFYVLRHTAAPAVLIEFGFISNDEEAAWLEDILNQVTLVQAVALAVKAWLKGD